MISFDIFVLAFSCFMLFTAFQLVSEEQVRFIAQSQKILTVFAKSGHVV